MGQNVNLLTAKFFGIYTFDMNERAKIYFYIISFRQIKIRRFGICRLWLGNQDFSNLQSFFILVNNRFVLNYSHLIATYKRIIGIISTAQKYKMK